MHKRFVFAIEDQPGDGWLSRFVAGRDASDLRSSASSSCWMRWPIPP
jgi:hypothetical protein